MLGDGFKEGLLGGLGEPGGLGPDSGGLGAARPGTGGGGGGGMTAGAFDGCNLFSFCSICTQIKMTVG